MHTVWKESYKLRTFDVDLTNHVKISSIFNFMQEAASNSADSLGFGYDQLVGDRLFWVLSRAKIHFAHLPSLGEEVTIETWPRGVDGLLALRDFRIFDGRRQEFATVTTSWLMVDEQTKRPVRSDVLLSHLPSLEDKWAIKEVAGKIVPVTPLEQNHEVSVRYSDLDINQHLNNVKYIEYIQNCFEADHYRSNFIEALQVNFLCESKFGDHIRLMNDASNCYVEGINQKDQKVFQATVHWRR